MVSDRTFIFDISIPCGNPFLWYHGHYHLSRPGSHLKKKGRFLGFSISQHLFYAIFEPKKKKKKKGHKISFDCGSILYYRILVFSAISKTQFCRPHILSIWTSLGF